MLTLKELSQKLKEGVQFSPSDLSKIRLELSGHLGLIAEELTAILEQKPGQWLELRKQSQSSSEADKKWEASELGIQEMKLRWDIKVVDKISSSLRLRLEVMDKEARNLY